MLSYPLCPFFVVFCNVVGTSNPQDFQLLQDVTDGISTLVTENKFVNRLHRLCATLLGLCKPLVSTPIIEAQAHFPNMNTMPAPNLPTPPVGADHGGLEHGASGVGGQGADGFMASSWNDNMMWQLFQSQPSLDWFNADILDPTWDFNGPK
jgi:hypothetical protein